MHTTSNSNSLNNLSYLFDFLQKKTQHNILFCQSCNNIPLYSCQKDSNIVTIKCYECKHKTSLHINNLFHFIKQNKFRNFKTPSNLCKHHNYYSNVCDILPSDKYKTNNETHTMQTDKSVDTLNKYVDIIKQGKKKLKLMKQNNSLIINKF